MLDWLVQKGHAEITVLCDVQPEYVSRAAEKVATFACELSQFPLLPDPSELKFQFEPDQFPLAVVPEEAPELPLSVSQ